MGAAAHGKRAVGNPPGGGTSRGGAGFTGRKPRGSRNGAVCGRGGTRKFRGSGGLRCPEGGGNHGGLSTCGDRPPGGKARRPGNQTRILASGSQRRRSGAGLETDKSAARTGLGECTDSRSGRRKLPEGSTRDFKYWGGPAICPRLLLNSTRHIVARRSCFINSDNV